MRFSKAFLKKFQTDFSQGSYDDDLKQSLESLHKYWYLINGLENKHSDIAERKREEFKSNFYVESKKVIDTIEKRFTQWLNLHKPDSFWRSRVEAAKQWLQDGGEFHPAIVNDQPKYITDAIIREAEKLMGEDIDIYQVREDLENGNYADNVQRYLENKKIPFDAEMGDEELFNKHVQDEGLLTNFAQWMIDSGYYEEMYSGSFNPEDNPELYFEAALNLAHSEIQDIYDNFTSRFPEWDTAIEGVSAALTRLSEAKGNPKDINGIMTAISLALNTAHNNGAMADNIGLDSNNLDELSNLNMSNEDSFLSRFSHKFVCQ